MKGLVQGSVAHDDDELGKSQRTLSIAFSEHQEPIRRARLHVSVVTYHGEGGVLAETLRSLLSAVERAAAERQLETQIDVISNDECPREAEHVAEAVRSVTHPAPDDVNVRLVRGQGNVGFGAAHNLAIRESAGDFHLVLNPDVIVEPDAITRSLAFLEDRPEAVMCVPQGYDASGDYACLAKRQPSLFVLFLRALTVRPSNRWFGRLVGRYVYDDTLPANAPVPIQHASGCFMFCRSAALKAVNGFDERFFLYFEDYDLSARISRLGEIFEVPDVVIKHFGGDTAQQGWLRIRRFLRSAVTYFRTYGWRLV